MPVPVAGSRNSGGILEWRLEGGSTGLWNIKQRRSAGMKLCLKAFVHASISTQAEERVFALDIRGSTYCSTFPAHRVIALSRIFPWRQT